MINNRQSMRYDSRIPDPGNAAIKLADDTGAYGATAGNTCGVAMGMAATVADAAGDSTLE